MQYLLASIGRAFLLRSQNEKGNENLGHVCHRTELQNIPRYVVNNRDLEPKEVQKVLLPSFLREYITRQWATSSIYVRAYKVSKSSQPRFYPNGFKKSNQENKNNIRTSQARRAGP